MNNELIKVQSNNSENQHSPFGSFGYTALKESRKLFSDKQQGGSVRWSSAIKRGISPDELKIMRPAFGEGSLGQRVFENIAQGVKCEYIEESRYICNNLSSGTFDFDIARIGDHDSVYHCEEHKGVIWSRLQAEVQNGNINAAVGENGKGRG